MAPSLRFSVGVQLRWSTTVWGFKSGNAIDDCEYLQVRDLNKCPEGDLNPIIACSVAPSSGGARHCPPWSSLQSRVTWLATAWCHELMDVSRTHGCVLSFQAAFPRRACSV